jgi:5-methylcytosine-specific restriction protein A
LPTAPPSLCAEPGCYVLVHRDRNRCNKHQADLEWQRAQRDHERGSASARGYGHHWRNRRLRFLKANPLCVDPFARHPHTVTPATVADHIIPHRGNRELFEDPKNLQGLCDPCHRIKTARGE